MSLSFWSAITRAEAAILSVFHLMHGKILAESFQFDWKESIFYKLDKYIQPDCITTNQPSQTELSKCHDHEERSSMQLKPESTTRRFMEKI